MNARRLFSNELACRCVLVCAMLLAAVNAFGQAGNPESKTQGGSAAKTASATRANAERGSAPRGSTDATVTSSRINEPYSAEIKKNTTEKFFLTALVDHLPASHKVPSPEKVLGYSIGTPNKLTYTKDMYRYYRELERATPRVRVFMAPEKSEEGREQMLVVVSDEANIAKLERYKEINARLADPRKTDAAAAQQLISEGKAIY